MPAPSQPAFPFPWRVHSFGFSREPDSGGAWGAVREKHTYVVLAANGETVTMVTGRTEDEAETRAMKVIALAAASATK